MTWRKACAAGALFACALFLVGRPAQALVPLAGSDATDISATRLGAPERFMLYPSPDGRRWVYAGGPRGKLGARQLFVCDRYGENVTQITHDETLKVPGPWSPDGRRILYIEAQVSESGRSIRQRLVCINADGSGKRVLSPRGVFLYLPVWSPDGRRIIFGSPRGLGMISAEGGQTTRLFGTDDPHRSQRCFPVAWLSAPPAALGSKAAGWGECVLYVTYTEKTELGRRGQFYLLNLDTLERIFLGQAVCLVPQASADCSVIAYFDWAGNLYVANPWRLNPRRVARCNGIMGLAPDGKLLLYGRYGPELRFLRVPDLGGE